jgi:hypothetical protein
MEEEVQGVVAEAGTVPVWRRSTEVAVVGQEQWEEIHAVGGSGLVFCLSRRAFE